jgi:hypothetical protein
MKSLSLSCIFLPDAIGVGSSGALMGMLSAWLIWIVFRWLPSLSYPAVLHCSFSWLLDPQEEDPSRVQEPEELPASDGDRCHCSHRTHPPTPLSDFLLLSSLLFLCAVGLLLQQVCRLGRSLRRNHPRHHLRCDGPDERARQCLLQGLPPPLLSSFSHHTSHCLSVWFLLSLSVCAVQWGLRILSLFLFGTSFGWALYTMLHNMHPSRDNFDLYDENDDWGHS